MFRPFLGGYFFVERTPMMVSIIKNVKYVINNLTKNAIPTSGMANNTNAISKIVASNLLTLCMKNHIFTIFPVHFTDDITTNAPSVSVKNTGIRIYAFI